MQTVQQRLQDVMAQRQLKQVDILRLSQPYQQEMGISMSKSHLSQYVNGKSQPDQYKLLLLAKTLDLDPAWLMGYEASDETIPEQIYNISLTLNTYHQEKVLDYAQLQQNNQQHGDSSQEGLDESTLYPIETVEGVAAGIGFSYEDMNRTATYYTDRNDFKSYSFATRVFGDSMADLIMDGDIVLIQQGYDNQSGGIYAVDYDGKSFLKKVYLEDNQFIMKSINPKYKDIIIDLPIPEGTYLNIIGKVVDWFTPKIIY
ncbi:S24 family peptidase [Fundicoccus sp. Sow4_H7]|uniref:S24 family peptidase n=1 Tax=Fundicoccus sp. Sow4_H7 TaxID=3438784 RepID=UPI003F8E7114